MRLSGVEDGERQLDMFGQTDDKRRRLATFMDRLNASQLGASVLHGHQLEVPGAGRRRGLRGEGKAKRVDES